MASVNSISRPATKMDHSPQLEPVTVVVVPFPAHSHLNQLLHLSLLLSTEHHVPVHFASTSVHNRQARLRLQGWPTSSLSSIHFHDLPLSATIPSPPPDSSAANSFPSHLQPLFEASSLLRAPLSSLFRSLSAFSRRLVVVHDPLMSFAGLDSADIPNAESYVFHCLSALHLLYVTFSLDSDNAEEQLKSWSSDIFRLLSCQFEKLTTEDFRSLVERRRKDMVMNSGNIVNTCRAAEGRFIDFLAQTKAYSAKPIFAVGPLNPAPTVLTTVSSAALLGSRESCQSRDECLEWLDKQPAGSVLYVSFGTMSTISGEQEEQLAAGLRRSRQRFLWVVRDADRADIFDGETRNRGLPAGFERDVEGVGKVVNWAPQLNVLAHRATGGFMSHCGWNSCVEAMSSGVAVIGWPMHSDQPMNARFLAEWLKVGVVVREWDRRREVVAAERVEGVVRMVMVEEEGRKMRERAKELGAAVRAEAGEGGSSKEALDSFVARLRR